MLLRIINLYKYKHTRRAAPSIARAVANLNEFAVCPIDLIKWYYLDLEDSSSLDYLTPWGIILSPVSRDPSIWGIN